MATYTASYSDLGSTCGPEVLMMHALGESHCSSCVAAIQGDLLVCGDPLPAYLMHVLYSPNIARSSMHMIFLNILSQQKSKV